MGAVATEDAPDGLIPKQLEDAGAGGTDIDQGAVADGVTACNLQCASLEVGHAGEIVDAGKLEGPFACLREGVRSADGGGHDERAGGRGNVGGEDQLGAGAGDEASSGQGRGDRRPAGGGSLQHAPGENRENTSVSDSDGGIRGRIESEGIKAEILREDAGVTRSSIGDVLHGGPSGDIRLARGGDEHDATRAVVGGEVRSPETLVTVAQLPRIPLTLVVAVRMPFVAS